MIIKRSYIDANILYGQSRSQGLPYDEIEMWHGHLDLYMNNFEEFLNTLIDNDIGNLLEVDSKSPANIKLKTKKIPSAPESEINHQDTFIEYMKEMKPNTVHKTKIIIYDWTKKYIYISDSI